MELATKEKFDIYLAIVRRAQLMGIAQGNQFFQIMDIEEAILARQESGYDD